jgi:hypothetical protein
MTGSPKPNDVAPAAALFVLGLAGTLAGAPPTMGSPAPKDVIPLFLSSGIIASSYTDH